MGPGCFEIPEAFALLYPDPKKKHSIQSHCVTIRQAKDRPIADQLEQIENRFQLENGRQWTDL